MAARLLAKLDRLTLVIDIARAAEFPIAQTDGRSDRRARVASAHEKLAYNVLAGLTRSPPFELTLTTILTWEFLWV
jgi:hypothetical protein